MRKRINGRVPVSELRDLNFVSLGRETRGQAPGNWVLDRYIII